MKTDRYESNAIDCIETELVHRILVLLICGGGEETLGSRAIMAKTKLKT